MDEAFQFEESIYNLLTNGGKMKSTVKLGLYPMDHELIKHAQKEKLSLNFWDSNTNTIDYSLAQPLLEFGLLPHGDIERENLLAWYSKRGKEKRYEISDLKLLFSSWRRTSYVRDYNDRVRVEAIK